MAKYDYYQASPIPEVSDEISALAEMAWEELTSARSDNKAIPSGSELTLKLQRGLGLTIEEVKEAVIYMQIVNEASIQNIRGYRPLVGQLRQDAKV